MLSEKEQMDRVKEVEQESLDVFHKVCTENHLKLLICKTPLDK